MEDKITYGVLWKTKLDPDEWQLFSGWYETAAEAMFELAEAGENPRCIEARVVERTETFETFEVWRARRWKLN